MMVAAQHKILQAVGLADLLEPVPHASRRGLAPSGEALAAFGCRLWIEPMATEFYGFQ